MTLSAETSISIIILAVSLIYFFFPPKKINYLYGYRTARSMKSDNRWEIANKLAPKMMIALSLFDAVLGYVVADILNYDFLYLFTVLLIIEFILLFYIIERKLAKIEPLESDSEDEGI